MSCISYRIKTGHLCFNILKRSMTRVLLFINFHLNFIIVAGYNENLNSSSICICSPISF